MLLKPSLATDYSGVNTIPLKVTPRAAVELIQTVTIVDFAVLTPLVTWSPATITIDAPSWANFARYKKIQFSIGSVGGTGTQVTLFQTRRNFTNYTATKFYVLEAITAAATINYQNTNSPSGVPLHISTGLTTDYIKQCDIFMTQVGGYAETTMGNYTTLVAGSISRTNFSILNPQYSLAGLPGYTERDTIGIQLFPNTNNFRVPMVGNIPLRNYKLECNIYGWLR